MKSETLKTALLAAGLVLAIAACGGPEPEPEPEPGPAPDAEPGIRVSPPDGPAGSEVTVHGEGFQPGARIGIGFGPPDSEYEVLAHATADADGAVDAAATVPDWAESGRAYVFVAVAPGGGKAVSSPYRVTPAGAAAGDAVRVTGVLTDEGVECPALRTDQGELYTLAGDTGGFGVGDRVTVEGPVARMSTCMQGTTIAVERITGAG